MSKRPRSGSSGAGRTAPFLWQGFDDVRLPCIIRHGTKYSPVQVVERLLLAPLASNPTINQQFTRRPLVASHFISEEEAASLNANAGDMYGPFSHSTLVVSLPEFTKLFSDLKAACAISNVTGGWVQINNSVIPYVCKDQVRMVPLAVVQNAAGLLSDVDQSCLPVRYPSVADCAYLNKSCEAAGLQFTFETTTPLIELMYVCRQSRRTSYLRYLPNDNPFSHARYVDEGGVEVPLGIPQQQTLVGDQPVAAYAPAGQHMFLPVQPPAPAVHAVPTVRHHTQNGPVVISSESYNLPPSALPAASTYVRPTADTQQNVQTARTSRRVELQPIVFRDRTISSLRKHDGNYVLLEALCRVCFPQVALETFIHIVENVLKMPIITLSDEEERYFIKFYRLPTECLRSNKMIRLDIFNGLCPQLESLLRSRQSVDSAATSSIAGVGSSAEHTGGLPVGTVFLRRPSGAEASPTAVPEAVPSEPVGAAGSDNNNGPQPPKRRRRPNISSDVIVID